MTRHHRRLAALGLALALGTLAPLTNAVGLGPAQVRSKLNQPLEVQVPLTGLKAGELENLRVGMADEAAFARAGLDRAAVPADLHFELRGQGAQGSYVRISSRGLVREPQLGVVLEVRSGERVVQRSYELLLSYE
jgi:pilus assembly protein FimV